MKLQKYIPAHLCTFLILGVLTGFYFKISTQLLTILLIASFSILSVVYFSLKNKFKSFYFFTAIAFVVFFLIGIATITFQKGENHKNHYSKIKNVQEKSIIIKIIAVLKSNDYYEKYEAEILEINQKKYSGKILLNVRKDSLQRQFNIDEKLLTITNFKEISPPKNPNQFNYKRYLEKQNIYHQLTINSNELKVLSSNITSLKGLAHRFRTKVITNLEKNGFKNDELSIISSLLLGQRQEVSKEILENYSKAGAIHILAISGLHVGIILLLLNFILKPLTFLKNGKTIKLILVLLLLWVFAFIAGLSASVVRAVTMFSAVAISIMGNRQRNVYYSLIFSALFLLLIHPFYLFDVGFQLSYLAVFFIVWLQPIIEKLWKPKLKILKYPWQLFTVSLAAQIGVLPLSLYYFHQFPGLFFLTNLIVIPFLGFILGLGFIVIFLALLNMLPKLLVNFYEIVISLMNSFIAWIAKQESFLFENIAFSVLLMIVSYFFIISFFNWIQNKSFKTLRIALICLALLQTTFIYEKWKTSSTNEIVVFNQNKRTLIAKRAGKNTSFYSSDSVFNKGVLSNYLQENFAKKQHLKTNIEPTLLLAKKIFIVDSLGVYNIPNLHPEKVLLINSPRVNLDRLISKLKPKQIIADNSNYKSLIANWEKTCNKHKISFYYTNKLGAFNVTY